ncbi:PP2C like phosphatase [Cryptosporidium xiaoi]|uniref:Protein phosphatase n=1 Tax=Cryptosporidium xiaoi TaxID=659607 RepID=A0AAV9Y2T7_9CRYT
MLTNENISRYIQSNECLLGINILLNIYNSDVIENSSHIGDNKTVKNQNILPIINILDRKRKKIERSRESLSRLKTEVLFNNSHNNYFTEIQLNSIKNDDEINVLSEDTRNGGEITIESSIECNSELLGIREEVGSWDNPIPNINGVPYDYYERKILEKYLEYWKKSKLSVPFSDWDTNINNSKSISNLISSEIVDSNELRKGCKSIQEAIYKLRKLEQDFQCIPKHLIIQILKNGSLNNSGVPKECNRAKLLSDERNKNNNFKVPQSLFLEMIINEHNNNNNNNNNKSTNLVKNSSLSNYDSVSNDNKINNDQCRCDFYKVKQKFMNKYDLCNISNNNIEENKGDLRIWMGAYYLPRNDKRNSGGEDGWFVAENIQSMGVADGVGEWEDLSGKSAKNFSNNLMLNSLNYIKKNMHYNGVRENPSILAKKSLINSLKVCVDNGVHGASTALVSCFDHTTGILGFANMGDSGALVLRRLQFDTGKMEIVRRVKEMQHDFNCPYQFATLPDEREWPELIEKGYVDIVNIASIERDRMNNSKSNCDNDCKESQNLVCDDPELSQLLDIKVKEGDMIIIGTDGLFDNLFDFEITSIAGLSYSPIESKLFYKNLNNATSPMLISKALALSAYHKSLDPFTKTPFANQAKKFYSGDKNSLICNQTFSGGKEDDITVLVAWVVNKNDFEILVRNSPNICDIKKKF